MKRALLTQISDAIKQSLRQLSGDELNYRKRDLEQKSYTENKIVPAMNVIVKDISLRESFEGFETECHGVRLNLFLCNHNRVVIRYQHRSAITRHNAIRHSKCEHHANQNISDKTRLCIVCVFGMLHLGHIVIVC